MDMPIEFPVAMPWYLEPPRFGSKTRLAAGDEAAVTCVQKIGAATKDELDQGAMVKCWWQRFMAKCDYGMYQYISTNYKSI